MNLVKSSLISSIILGLTFNSACQRLTLSTNPNTGNTQIAKTQLIIKRKLTESLAQAKVSILAENKVKNIQKLGVEVIQVPDNVTTEAYIKELETDPTIDYVEQNFIRRATMLEPTPEDTSLLDLRGYLGKNITNPKLKPIQANTISTKFNDPNIGLQYALESIHADKAWPISSGSEKVIVAVVDTGVDLEHPDLKENLVDGYTTVKGTSTPNDDNGHGTHVAGIIAALSNNSRGGVGLAPKCKVMPIKVLSAKGEGSDSDIAEALIWAVDHGANIINLSLGGNTAGKTLENAMQYAYNSGVLVLAAMGNNGTNAKIYPAAYKNVVAVAATDAKNKVAPFSNYGEWVSVSAPGLKIYSTFPTYKVELSRYNISPNYGILSGTSMATPYVAGMAALILSKNSTLSRTDLRKKIEQSTNDIDVKGFDQFSGTGLIDASKAVK